MARASTYTLLPLDTAAKIVGIDPWSFNGARYPAPKSAQCEDVMYQYQWQKDHLSREEWAQAIADAERMLAAELLYWPAPQYFVDEVVQYPRPYQRQLFGYAGTPRGEWKTFQLNWKKIVSGGVFNRTSIGNIPAGDITKLDEDGDGVFETFQAIITDAVIGNITDPYELALYFVAGDRHGESLDETWRVRPVRVSITGNTATFTGHRTLLLNPEPEFQVNPTPTDATVDANYITSLDCYRVFTDTTATESTPYQGVAIWKNIPSCTQDCTFSVKELCLGEHANDQGRVFASFGEQCLWPFPDREPDRLEVNYVAGVPLENGFMNPEMARIVTYIAVSLLANEQCGCNRSNRILEYWRQRVTRFEDNSANARAYSDADIPFPMTVGGVWAWNRVKRLREIEVVSI